MSSAVVTTPERSLAQRQAALQTANDIRTKRAELKRKLKSGDTKTSSVIAKPPEYIASMKVYNLLIATPKLGRVKVGDLLTAAGVSPSKTVGGLNTRQRKALADVLRGRGK